MRQSKWPFCSVTARERREADLFYADLMGEPHPTRARRFEAEQLGEDLPGQNQPRLGPDTLSGFPAAPGRGMPGEQTVRAAVVRAALAESARWHNSTGAPIFESNVTMFGNLVRYYLAVIRTVRPDTLVQLQDAAIAATTSYGTLPTTTSSAATVTREVQRVRGVLMAAASNTGVPADLADRVETALRRARQAHLDSGAYSAWSAVWVSHCVRSAGITLGLEAIVAGTHHGADGLLLPTTSHWEYVRDAFRARSGGRATYRAFDPALVAPEPGDIIVQDRTPSGGFTFAGMPPSNMNTHGDIVITITASTSTVEGNVVTRGGNLGMLDAAGQPIAGEESVRARRYPLGTNGRLVVSATRVYSQEDDTGTLPAVPAAITATSPLASRSTARIFTVLKPVPIIMDVPQPVPGQALA